jgi:MATE family multidrug resistance protein
MMKLLMIFSYFIDGFAYAGEAMAGKYIGAQNKRLLQSTVKYNFLWSLGVAAVFVGVYAFGGPALLKVMTDDPSVLTVCKQFLPWLVMMPIAGFVAFTWDGIYIGATASKTIRNSMIWSVAAFYLVFFVGVKTFEGPDAAINVLLAAYFAHLLARSIHLTVKNKRIVFTDPFVSDKE